MAASWCLILLCMSAESRAQETIIVLAMDYPPYEFMTADGRQRGCDLEVVREALNRCGYRVDFQFYPWSRVMRMMQTGEGVAAISATKTIKRTKYLEFSDPISAFTEVILVRKDFAGPVPNKYEDFRGIALGTMIDWVFSDKLKKLNIKHDMSKDEPVALQKLVSGRIDGIVTTLESTLYQAKKLGLNSRHFKWGVVEEVPFRMCLSKKWPEAKAVLEAFNAMLAEMKEDGSYDEIHARYR